MYDYKDEQPTKGMFWLALKWIGFIALLILAVRFIVMPFFVADKLIGREVQKFDAETSAQVYDNSRQFQQGTNRDLARYCREYQTSEGAAKKAVASLILSTADTYQGDLTPANQACLLEIEQ